MEASTTKSDTPVHACKTRVDVLHVWRKRKRAEEHAGKVQKLFVAWCAYPVFMAGAFGILLSVAVFLPYCFQRTVVPRYVRQTHAKLRWLKIWISWIGLHRQQRLVDGRWLLIERLFINLIRKVWQMKKQWFRKSEDKGFVAEKTNGL